jgi:hypothetical protein
MVCALIAGFACFFSSNAFSIQEIEFYVSNNTNVDRWFQCIGPFSRQSPRVSVSPSGEMTYFYTASVTSFSPYGHWSCFVYTTDNCFDPVPVPEEDTFSTDLVIPAGSALVDLSISEVQGGPVINVNFPGFGTADGDEIAVASNLGNDQVHSKSDVDTFSFKAEEGDEITIKLDGDPSASHIGSQAALRLRSSTGMGRFQIDESGEVPLVISTTIPETGVYEVMVWNSDVPDNLLQSDVPDNLLNFKGGYILSAKSAENKIKSLVPSGNVEN